MRACHVIALAASCASACALPPCPPNASMALAVELPEFAATEVPMTFGADDGVSFAMTSDSGNIEVTLPERPSQTLLPPLGTAVTVDYEADDSFYVIIRAVDGLVFEGGRPGGFPRARRMTFGGEIDGPQCLDRDLIRTPATLRFQMDEQVELASSEETRGTIEGVPFAAIALSADSYEQLEQKPDCCGTDANGFLIRLSQE